MVDRYMKDVNMADTREMQVKTTVCRGGCYQKARDRALAGTQTGAASVENSTELPQGTENTTTT